MGWKDLLEKNNETVTLPWLGGRKLDGQFRQWAIEGALPEEHCWALFQVSSKKASFMALADPDLSVIRKPIEGYLVGDRLVPRDVNVNPDPVKIAEQTESVRLIPDGLDRFSPVKAGRINDDGPLVFHSQVFPIGPENEVLQAYLTQVKSVSHIKGVPPALDVSFRMETFQREEAEKRRLELERIRLEEERKQKAIAMLGNAAGRREMAKIDFAEAARAALNVGGAIYLDHRGSVRRGEYVVTFRVNHRQFQCVCDSQLRIIDSGICLVDHLTGEKGDTRFTLESLPAVIRQADREGKLVVFRHVHDEDEEYD